MRPSKNWTWNDDQQINDENLLGQTQTFDQFDVYNNETMLREHTLGVTFRLVKNNSGGVLAAGSTVLQDTGTTYGPWVGVLGAGTADSEKIAGFVPWYFPASVAIAEIFPLIIGGPTKALYVAAGDHLLGEDLKAAAAGRVADWVKDTDNHSEIVATSMELKDSGVNDDLFWVYARLGREAGAW